MTIEELHDKLFDVLCIVDDICKSNNIKYYLDSGTELGAVREHDFIKWDDDMDLKIMAEDYPAFKKAMEENLPPYMHIIEPDALSPAFFDFVIRIIDERYTLRKESEENDYYKNYQNYVGTDVFLMFKCPASKFVQKKMILKTKILYGFGMAHRYSIDYSKYSGLQKVQVFVLATLGKLFSAEKTCKRFFKAMNKYSGIKSDFRLPAQYQLKSLQFFPEDIYSDTVYMPIREREFPVPKGYDRELTQQYGDYMKPPKDTSIFVKHLD